jgi:hypothetical protein
LSWSSLWRLRLVFLSSRRKVSLSLTGWSQKSWFSCLSVLSAGITEVCHHTS